MEPIEYLHLQMRLEGKGLVNVCSIRQIEIVPDEEVPLVLIARLANGELVTYQDETLPPVLQMELTATSIVFPHVEPLLDVLASHHRQAEVGHYKTYVFPAKPDMEQEVVCLSKHDASVKAFGFDGFFDEVYAIERNGSLVSACVSTRENESCGEAWIYTAPEYRKQGLAQKAVHAWARGLLEAGKVPFYSHKIENTASANLAKRLGLVPVFEEIAITQI